MGKSKKYQKKSEQSAKLAAVSARNKSFAIGASSGHESARACVLYSAAFG